MKVFLLCLFIVLLLGCARITVPQLEADNVECEYSRDGTNIAWQCRMSGTGTPRIFSPFD